MTFIRINNTLLNPEKVSAAYQDEKGEVIVIFDSGERLIFTAPEAADLWRHLDPDPGWNDKEG